MTSYAFRSTPNEHHQVLRRPNSVQVDCNNLPVRVLDASHYVVDIDKRPAHVHAIAHGDTIYLQMAGRTCVIERKDPMRSSGTSSVAGQGDACAPMPGMVVIWIAQPGSRVQAGEALLVIESMKMQITIEAPQAGLLEDLPFQPSQTFQRGAVLARIRPEEKLA
jgi:3-methylcrotonyl-CoA carboxylase alpha subunit